MVVAELELNNILARLESRGYIINKDRLSDHFCLSLKLPMQKEDGIGTIDTKLLSSSFCQVDLDYYISLIN